MTRDPEISEWGNPTGFTCYIRWMSERRELKHLSTGRKRDKIVIP